MSLFSTVTLKLSAEQDRAYREAADREGFPLATWIKHRADVGAIWPAVLKPLEEALYTLRGEYLDNTRPRDVSADDWNEFLRENLQRLRDAVICPVCLGEGVVVSHDTEGRERDSWPCRCGTAPANFSEETP
jgi:hypothetical protein